MTAMPTIQTPEGFLAECRKRGIKLTAKDGTIKASGKPPANPEKFAAFLRAKKPELLALLAREVKGSPAGEHSAALRHTETHNHGGEARLPPLADALYSDCRQQVLTWACRESKKGTLPEPGPITLPSGQSVPDGRAASYLLDRHDLAQRLRLQPWADCERAFLVLRQDLRALATACADAYPVAGFGGN